MATGRRFQLDLRRVFRAFAREEQQAYADALRTAGPPLKDGGTRGGSLPQRVRRAPVGVIRRWGYVVKLHTIGQVLTWFVRGTRHQPARPVRTPLVGARLADAVGREAAAQFRAWDR